MSFSFLSLSFLCLLSFFCLSFPAFCFFPFSFLSLSCLFPFTFPSLPFLFPLSFLSLSSRFLSLSVSRLGPSRGQEVLGLKAGSFEGSRSRRSRLLGWALRGVKKFWVFKAGLLDGSRRSWFQGRATCFGALKAVQSLVGDLTLRA